MSRVSRKDRIIAKIYFLRGEKIMLDFDLAGFYGIETRTLKQAVRRNLQRFPRDCMFTLNCKETREVVSQFVIPSRSFLGGATPMAFTEKGVAMLSSVLWNEDTAMANIEILRAFADSPFETNGVKKLRSLVRV